MQAFTLSKKLIGGVGAVAATQGVAVTQPVVGVKLMAAAPSRTDTFHAGDKVEARYDGQAQWYPGQITAVNQDGTYNLHYEDGDVELKVACFRIKQKGWVQKPILQNGEVVDARYGGNQHFYPGQITAVHEDDTYDIAYDDGDSEKKVQRDLIMAAYIPQRDGSCPLPPAAKRLVARKIPVWASDLYEDVLWSTPAMELPSNKLLQALTKWQATQDDSHTVKMKAAAAAKEIFDGKDMFKTETFLKDSTHNGKDWVSNKKLLDDFISHLKQKGF